MDKETAYQFVKSIIVSIEWKTGKIHISDSVFNNLVETCMPHDGVNQLLIDSTETIIYSYLTPEQFTKLKPRS